MTRNGYFGQFGGAFIPEILYQPISQLQAEFKKIKADPSFFESYLKLLKSYSGRPTPITYLKNCSKILNGAQIYVKREDLAHTGAHKVNNVLGQGLLCKRMGKKRVIAETGAGQHGIATATMAARLGLSCTIYMGEKDVDRQYPNVFWMKQLGATVIPVTDGSKTLKDAINSALRDWSSSFEETHYVLGTACGPHPFPEMVSWFQSVIGREASAQIIDMVGKIPDHVYACVGGGSNAMGIFQGFLSDDWQSAHTDLIGVEAGGKGLTTNQHASRIAGEKGVIGAAHGYKAFFLQNEDGQMLATHSIAAGLDYVGVSPILSHFHDQHLVRFMSATDDQVIKAFKFVVQQEGLIPALESTHAFAAAFEQAPGFSSSDIILINQSGRGDKDIFTIADAINSEEWTQFLKTRTDHVNQ